MARPNLYDDAFSFDDAPEGFRAGEINLGRLAGGTATNLRLYLVPPGEHICPYHYEYEEEWLLVISGEALLRTPAGTETLAPGAVVCFAPGPEGAHQVSCAGNEPVRAVMFSSAREPAVAVYPDGDKIGVWPGRDADELMLRREDGRRDYWDREGGG